MSSCWKDKEGERLIKLFSVPCKPTKSNGMRTRNLPQHYPADWAKFKSYCIQDVNTEVDIYKRLKRFPMPEQEWKHYRVNERINDRGVKIDTELVQQAIACDLMLSDAMSKKAYELTGLENPNSVSQLKAWLDERGIPMDTLGKKDVAQMIAELDKNGVDAEAMDMLKLRLQMAKSSVKKYQAAERCVCSDGRARGLFQFYGASRTGRYSGRNIQLQNLPQNHISTLDEARELVKLGCFDMVETIYGNTPDVLSQLIRTMLIPKDGCEFIVADFSAIEARVLAWEAGEDWRLEAFLEGKDIYCASASQMFHVPVVKHGINGELRQKGKVAELACGYGGSSGALISMGALQMGLKVLASMNREVQTQRTEQFLEPYYEVCEQIELFEVGLRSLRGQTRLVAEQLFVDGKKQTEITGADGNNLTRRTVVREKENALVGIADTICRYQKR